LTVSSSAVTATVTVRLRPAARSSGALEAPWPAPGAVTPRDPAGTAPLDAWLDALPGADAAAAAAIEESADWRAAVDLWAAGLTTQAASRFHLAIERTANPWAILHAARAFDTLGIVHLRLAAAVNLLERIPRADRPGAPLQILQWVYPLGWPDLSAAAASNFGVDELLLYAMIRQESLFNPRAGSVAGALGLTQVIPTTSADIARMLDDGGFQTTLLFRPERSIRYGAAYLGSQLANFDGSVPIALAAYNGGPGNAARWSQGAAALDPDLFYEAVSFGETRAYLRLVLENYAWYQYVYGGAPTPTLLRPPP
jgi:soluble lytic murein transglycosylase